MKLGKRLWFLLVTLLSIGTLVFTGYVLFEKTTWQMFAIAAIAWTVTTVVWFCSSRWVSHCDASMDPAAVSRAYTSKTRHVITSMIALSLTFILLLIFLFAGTVWNFAEDNGVNFGDVILDKLHVQNLEADNLDVTNANVTNLNAEDVTIDNAHINEAEISKAHINEAEISKAHINEAEISKAHIEKATIDNAYIEDATINNAYIEDATINNAHIGNAIIDKISGVLSGLGSGGGDGSGDGNSTPPSTTVPNKEPITEPYTEPVTKPNDDITEPTTEAKRSMIIKSDKKDRYGLPVMRTSADNVTITLINCTKSDINWYWIDLSGKKTKQGVDLVSIGNGEYKLSVDEALFENSFDIMIQNPADPANYAMVTIEPIE